MAENFGIAYYRYEWVVQEFADLGTRIFFTKTDEQSKQHALQHFHQLFEPEDVIEAAYRSEP